MDVFTGAVQGEWRMKRLLVVILFILLLTGCGERTDSQNSEKSNMFVCVESDFNHGYDIVYHRDTKVMYAVSDDAYNRGTFTLLVNSDGTPMLYEESKE